MFGLGGSELLACVRNLNVSICADLRDLGLQLLTDPRRFS